MSRLYTKINSDTGDTPATKTGHEYIYVEVYYGDAKDSKLFKRLMFKWTKRMKEPKMIV